MKTKKHVWMKIIFGVFLAALFVGLLCICMTKSKADKIPHRYASAKEGCRLLLDNTEYYDKYSQNDIDFRLQKSGATLQELFDESTKSIQDFSFMEKLAIDYRLSQMQKTIEENGYVFPPIEEIVFIKMDMTLESGAEGYTHGTQIYLNADDVSRYAVNCFDEKMIHNMDKVLWHELFHCLTRNNSDFRKEMYSLINFTVTDSEFEIPPCVKNLYISNPDVEHHDSYATFEIEGREIDCFIVWKTTMSFDEAHSKFIECNEVALVPIDGTDTYYTKEQASNFDEVFGTNTGYVIDPEECMADNFMYAMIYGVAGRKGKGYPNPEIIRGIVENLSR